MNLTQNLEPFRPQIEQTAKSVVRFTVSQDPASFAWQSKLGGAPYQAPGQEWPLDDTGKGLQFLAQINFAEVPALVNFPQKGLLQFFVGTDSLHGLNFDDQIAQKAFRVVFHPEPSEAGILFTPPPIQNLVVEKTSTMTFSTDNEPVTHGDFRFQTLLGRGFFDQFGEKKWATQPPCPGCCSSY